MDGWPASYFASLNFYHSLSLSRRRLPAKTEFTTFTLYFLSNLAHFIEPRGLCRLNFNLILENRFKTVVTWLLQCLLFILRHRTYKLSSLDLKMSSVK